MKSFKWCRNFNRCWKYVDFITRWGCEMNCIPNFTKKKKKKKEMTKKERKRKYPPFFPMFNRFLILFSALIFIINKTQLWNALLTKRNETLVARLVPPFCSPLAFESLIDWFILLLISLLFFFFCYVLCGHS